MANPSRAGKYVDHRTYTVAEVLAGADLDDTLLGGLGADSLDGGAGSDSLVGGAGNDTITGGLGDDTLLGGAGNDWLRDDQGSNVLDGGEGSDTLQAWSLAGAYTLSGGLGNDDLDGRGRSLLMNGGEGNDNLAATSEYFYGPSTSYAQQGVATLSGGSGNDTLRAVYLADARLQGDDGDDMLSVAACRNALLQGGAGRDTLTAAFGNGFNALIGASYGVDFTLDGGAGDDTLTASGRANPWGNLVRLTLAGGAGNDKLVVDESDTAGTGGGGVSQALLSGGDGNDTLSACGVLALTLTGGAGRDVFVLSARQHALLLSGTTGFTGMPGSGGDGYVMVAPQAVDITDFQAGAGGDVLDVSELLKSAAIGFDGSNPFAGGYLKLLQRGADTLVQFDADGSVGTTSAPLTIATLRGVTASRLASANFTPNYPPDGSAAAGRKLSGTQAADTLSGGLGADTVDAGAGNDSVDGGAGNDSLLGGAGDDTILGGLGNDTLLGGEGKDSLSDDAGANLLDGGAGNDTLSALSLTGTHTLSGGLGDDTLNGCGKSLSMSGGDGSDVLDASGRISASGAISFVSHGVATLSGGGGNDTLNAGFLADARLQGDEGDDVLSVASCANALLQGGAGKDTLRVEFNNGYSSQTGAGFEMGYSLDGGADDDSLTVTGYANAGGGLVALSLAGGGGNDRLVVDERVTAVNGGGGVNQALLNGGDGNDTLTASGVLALTLTGGAGSDVFVLTARQHAMLLNGAAWFSGMPGSGGGYGYVTVAPRAMDITDFQAGAGGDVLDVSELLKSAAIGFDGSNPFAGGYLKLLQRGADTLVQFDADGSVGTASAPLTIATLRGVTASRLASANFTPNYPPDGSAAAGRKLSGTQAADTLSGGLGADTVDAGAGNDSVDGGVGNDSLLGGAGDDTILGGLGNDTLLGGDGNDSLGDDQGANLLDGGAGNDRLSALSLSGAHTLSGGLGDDTLNGCGKSLTMSGGDGNDRLDATGQLQLNGASSYVQLGAGTLRGGGGDDILSASYLADARLQGNDGGDVLIVTFTASAQLQGGAGDDHLGATLVNSFSAFGAGYGTGCTLDGGADNDVLDVTAYGYAEGGQMALTLLGGSGNDWLAVSERLTADNSRGGVSQALLSGGDGNDTLTASGVLAPTLTGGGGSDVFVLNTQQYKTQLQGQVQFATRQGTADNGYDFGMVTVEARGADITDFKAGAGGDVLDLSNLLVSATSGFNGANPFAGGYLKLVQAGADTLLRFDADGSAGTASAPLTIATLRGVTAAQLGSANFNPGITPTGSIGTSHLPTGRVTVSGAVTQGQTLTAAHTLADADGLGAIAYQWLRAGAVIAGATGASYKLTQADVGKAISVKAYYTDGLGLAESVTSAPTAAVAPAADQATGTAGADVLHGGAGASTLQGLGGNDQLWGEAGNDLLNGGDGNDTLVGGTGLDTLTGGSGQDAFRFTGAFAGGASVDTLTDFNTVDDRLELDRAYFTALGTAGMLPAAKLALGTRAADADDRLVYDRASGQLYYDDDGSGAHAAVLIAKLGVNTVLMAQDLFVI